MVLFLAARGNSRVPTPGFRSEVYSVFRLSRLISAWFARWSEGQPRSGSVLLWILRGCFGAVVISTAMIAFQSFSEPTTPPTWTPWLAFFGILFLGVGIVATDLLIRNKQITTISAVYFGLLLGLLLGNILSTALDPFVFEWESNRPEIEAVRFQIEQYQKDGKDAYRVIAPSQSVARPKEQGHRKALMALLITVVCCYISVSTLLQTKDEFRFIIPYVEFSRQVKGARPLVLDTSVIIDGRIADICDTRFIDTRLIVPRFVLQELQSVADSSDKLKRNRGRRGLDMLKRMQNNNKIDLVMHDSNLPELRDVHKVDERLVVLAKALGARVVTNDYNLNKIAQLQGVEVINLNELANALKSVALPGEMMAVRLVKAGDQIGQGVGYLEDGTMVVVEQGRSQIGQEVTITVTSVLQTPAGRMIFGRIDNRPSSGPATPVPPTRSDSPHITSPPPV
jgi:uncharacterized protein YacL